MSIVLLLVVVARPSCDTDAQKEELAARHLAGELVQMPQFEGEREVENWFLKRGFKVEWI